MFPIPPGVTIEAFEVCAKPSASITLTDINMLAGLIEAGFAAGIDGAVITHGTDTIEETAFALSLMLVTSRPVVVTGAMRNPDQPGADGPANLRAAVAVASHGDAGDHGILVLFGDEIHSARFVRKVHSSRAHAFSSEPHGPVGHFAEDCVTFHTKVLQPMPHLRLEAGPLPVPILQVGLDLEPACIEAFRHAPVAGLIVAGVGGGHVSAASTESLQALACRIPVIVTAGVSMGATLETSYAYVGGDVDLIGRGLINGGPWRPCQARILLQLLLSNGMSFDWRSTRTLDDLITRTLGRDAFRKSPKGAGSLTHPVSPRYG